VLEWFQERSGCAINWCQHHHGVAIRIEQLREGESEPGHVHYSCGCVHGVVSGSGERWTLSVQFCELFVCLLKV
jgi:hypothetical protein